MCYGLRQRVLRIVVYAFVIAVWVGAGAFIGVGSYLASDMPSSDYSAIFDEDFDTEVWETSVYLTITLGCIIVFVGVAGFCGVWRESTFLLFVFILSIISFLAVEFILVILSTVFNGDVQQNVAETMIDQLRLQYVSEGADDSISQAWDKMQQDFECCGSRYFPDWKVFNSQYYQTTNNSVPYTCCDGEETNMVACRMEADGLTDGFEYLYLNSCAWEMMIKVQEQMGMIVATLSITMGLQIGAVVFGCTLRDNLKNHVRD